MRSGPRNTNAGIGLAAIIARVGFFGRTGEGIHEVRFAR
jgi:hypothetical protein